MEKKYHYQEKYASVPLASRKEWIKLGMIVFFALAIMVAFITHFRDLDQEKTRGKAISAEGTELILGTPQALPPAEVKPFHEEENALQEVGDDEALQTPAYYYLLHKIKTIPVEEITKAVDPKLGWNELITQESRDAVRGKFFRLQGTLVRLVKKTIVGDRAKERGLDGHPLWQGEIYNSDQRLFLFVITDFPANIHANDAVELSGVFYKVWQFISEENNPRHSPFFIGKTLRILPEMPKQVPGGLLWTFVALFGVTFLILMLAIWRENRGAQKFWQRYHQRQGEHGLPRPEKAEKTANSSASPAPAQADPVMQPKEEAASDSINAATSQEAAPGVEERKANDD